MATALDTPGYVWDEATGVVTAPDGSTLLTPALEATRELVEQAAARHAGELEQAEQLRTQAAQAITANRAFLAIASPTNAQTLAQVKALTRQNTAIIRALGTLTAE